MIKNNFFAQPILVVFLFLGFYLNAQTEEQRKQITGSYDMPYLRGLATQSLQKSIADKEEAIQYAQVRNIPISFTTDDGAFSELQRI